MPSMVVKAVVDAVLVASIIVAACGAAAVKAWAFAMLVTPDDAF